MAESDVVRSVQWHFRAQQWGRVKGELRTMADVLGAVASNYDEPPGEAQWQRFAAAAEAFIAQIEGDGLHE